MQRVIGGRKFNTETAKFICDISGPETDRGNFRYDSTYLYRTAHGRYFIAGHGGPLSRWRQSTGQNSWSGGEGIEAIDEAEARALAERHMWADNFEKVFGPVEEA